MAPPSKPDEAIRELVKGYHSLGLAVQELSTQVDQLECRVDRLDQAMFQSPTSSMSRLAVLETKVTEQDRVCRETRKTEGSVKAAQVNSRGMVTAAWIGGVLTFVMALLSLLATFLHR